MLKFLTVFGVIAFLVILTTSSAARTQFQRQIVEKRVQNREQESDDLDEGGSDKDDLKGSASYGYGYYGYPYGGYGGGLYSGGLYSGGLYGGGIYPYGYSLHSGYYGGYSPYHGGYGFPGHYF